MLDFLTNNLLTISTVVGVVYPSALYLLPANTASKISLGVKVVKSIATALENATNTKGGLTSEKELKSNRYIQKPK